MEYKLEIRETRAYLHAAVSGQHNETNARRFLKEAHEAWTRGGHTAVILEMNFSGPSLARFAILKIIGDWAPLAAALERIAYVDSSNERDPKTVQFAGTVAVDRGLRVRHFRDLALAKIWITEPSADEAKQPTSSV